MRRGSSREAPRVLKGEARGAPSDLERRRVSIVIPADNHAGYLDAAINSILAQNYPRVELLVLDDDSMASTRGVLEKYTGSFYWET